MQMFDARYQNTKDDVAFVSFYKRTAPTVKWKGKERIVTEEQVDFIHIRTPGDTKLEYEGPVTDIHRKRFPAQWQAYLTGASFKEGIPLEEWNFLTNSEIEFLNKRGVAYVEHVAHWPDGSISQLGPNGFAMRKKAQEFLAERDGSKEVVDLKDEVEELRGMVKRLLADATHTIEEGVTTATTSSPSEPPPASSSATPPPEPEPDPEPEPEPTPGKGKGRGKPKPPKGPKK